MDCLMYNGAVKLCMMISFCMFGFENPKHNLLLLLCSYFRIVAAGKMTFFLSLLMYRQLNSLSFFNKNNKQQHTGISVGNT